MNDKRFILIIFGAIALTVIISVIVGINVYSSNKSLELNVDESYSEENALKAKDMYSTEKMRQEFLSTAQSISESVTTKLLDGSVTDNASLEASIKNINSVLASNSWDILNIVRPTKWIGTWYLDSMGFLKFRFLNKTFEPDWVHDESVSEYIVLN